MPSSRSTPVQVVETPIAARQADGLRGPARRSYQAFLDLLASEGCPALGYRLTGPPPLPRLCVKHLRAQDRVVVAFAAVDEAWVLLVAPHTGDPSRNVYELLYRMVGTQPPDQARRTKPSCCDKDTGETPTTTPGDISDLVKAARRIAGRGR